MMNPTAYHEAAHACVACHFGFTPVEVSVEQAGREAGYTMFLAPPADPIVGTMVFMAGWVASRRVGVPQVLADAGAEDDFELITRLYLDRQEPYEMRAVAPALDELLTRLWPAVEEVAGLLSAQSTVGGRQVAEIVRKHS